MLKSLSPWALALILAGCSSSASTGSGDVVPPTTVTDAGATRIDAGQPASSGVDAGTAPDTGSGGGTGTRPVDAGAGAQDSSVSVTVADAAAVDAAGALDAAQVADSAIPLPPVDAGPLPPPVSDKTSTLGVSAPGAGYHVDGNIPYGTNPMQRLDVIYPNGAGPTGTTVLPGVIMFHGGGWTDNRPQALKASMSSFFDRFLKHGFIVCNVEYRLADGTVNGATAPAADQDALTAAQWFWNYMDYYHVDRTRYVVTGASAGGQLALMVGMATPAAQLGPTSPTNYLIAAIVNGYGPSDVTDLLAKNVSFAEQWLPASTPNRAALAVRVSPVTYARKDVPPLITVQGQDDTTVPTSESTELFNLLTAAGADTALHFVAGAGHGFDTPATAWPDAEATMFGFLTAHGIGQ